MPLGWLWLWQCGSPLLPAACAQAEHEAEPPAEPVPSGWYSTRTRTRARSCARLGDGVCLVVTRRELVCRTRGSVEPRASVRSAIDCEM